MKQRFWLMCLMLVVTIYVRPAYADGEPGEYSYSPSQTLPFEYYRERFIIVTATVNDTYTGRYLLDTGAGFTILYQSLADSIGFTPIDTLTVYSFDGTPHTVTLSTVVSFTVGSQTMNNAPVGIMDLPPDQRNVVGIIGGLFFEEFVITIDYPNRVIYFEDEESLSYRRRVGVVAETTIERYKDWGLDFYLPILLNYKWNRAYEVDTGSYSIFMNLDDVDRVLSDTTSSGELRMSFSLRDHPEIRIDQPKSVKAREAIKDGLLGNCFLEPYVVTFNIRDGYVIFAEPSDENDTFVDEHASAALPIQTALIGAYPNPFNLVTAISYQLAGPTKVDLIAYNLCGQVVGKLVTGRMEAGYYEATWDAAGLASGVYIVRLSAGGSVYASKVLLTK